MAQMEEGLRIRVRAGERGAWDATNFPPQALKALQIHLVERLRADATDCSRMQNQSWRARNHPGEDVARRPHAGS